MRSISVIDLFLRSFPRPFPSLRCIRFPDKVKGKAVTLILGIPGRLVRSGFPGWRGGGQAGGHADTAYPAQLVQRYIEKYLEEAMSRDCFLFNRLAKKAGLEGSHDEKKR